MTNNTNNSPKKTNATALKHIESLLPVVSLGMNGIQDRRQLEIEVRCVVEGDAYIYRNPFYITKGSSGKFVLTFGDHKNPRDKTVIQDPVEFFRLFLRNQRTPTIIRKITLQPISSNARAMLANYSRLGYTKLVVYETSWSYDNRRAIFENQRRNTAGRKIAAGITSAALNPATNLGRRRLMREFNDLMTR